MNRRFYIISAIGLAVALAYAVAAPAIDTITAVAQLLYQPNVEMVMVLTAVALTIAVARSSPEAARSFWRRLTARSRDPVPSTI
jgi:hypothetical protein